MVQLLPSSTSDNITKIYFTYKNKVFLNPNIIHDSIDFSGLTAAFNRMHLPPVWFSNGVWAPRARCRVFTAPMAAG